MRTLIKNALILPMTSDEHAVAPGDILIDGDRLASVGPEVPMAAADRVLDGAGKLAMPGLINCHNHAAMTFFGAYSDGRAARALYLPACVHQADLGPGGAARGGCAHPHLRDDGGSGSYVREVWKEPGSLPLRPGPL